MKPEPAGTSILSATAFLLAGPIVWAVHLLLVYGPQSALCAFGKSGVAEVGPSSISALVLAVTAIAAVPLLAVLFWPQATARLLRFRAEGSSRPFAISVARWLAALSLVGVLLAGATALMLDPCAQLR